MTALNRDAAHAAQAAGVRALTDVTGFGLLGHLTEMCGAKGDSPLGTEISAAALPLLPNVRGLMDLGMMPAGAYNNREAFQPRVRIAAAVPAWMEMLFYDPQTSGGLLAAVEPDGRERLEREAAARRGLVADRRIQCHRPDQRRAVNVLLTLRVRAEEYA